MNRSKGQARGLLMVATLILIVLAVVLSFGPKISGTVNPLSDEGIQLLGGLDEKASERVDNGDDNNGDDGNDDGDSLCSNDCEVDADCSSGTCGDFDDDSCLECGSADSCTDECTSNSECRPASCGDFDDDSCLECGTQDGVSSTRCETDENGYCFDGGSQRATRECQESGGSPEYSADTLCKDENTEASYMDTCCKNPG